MLGAQVIFWCCATVKSPSNQHWREMDVSENGGTPKSSILIGFSIINHPFWGTLFLETPRCFFVGSFSLRIVNCCKSKFLVATQKTKILGGGNSNIFYLGKNVVVNLSRWWLPIYLFMIRFDEHIFQRGWSHRLVKLKDPLHLAWQFFVSTQPGEELTGWREEN